MGYALKQHLREQIGSPNCKVTVAAQTGNSNNRSITQKSPLAVDIETSHMNNECRLIAWSIHRHHLQQPSTRVPPRCRLQCDAMPVHDTISRAPSHGRAVPSLELNLMNVSANTLCNVRQ
eukprot:3657237-Rhodomonas_salina.2